MSLLEKSHRLQISVRKETSGLERSGPTFHSFAEFGKRRRLTLKVEKGLARKKDHRWNMEGEGGASVSQV